MATPTKATVARPESWGYDALIEYGATDAESLYLRLAVGPGRAMSFQTVEPQQGGPDTAANPEDMRPETGATFSRSDLTGGGGLDRAHRRDGIDRDLSRYYDSEGVETALTERSRTPPLTLVRDTSAKIRTASSVNAGDLVRIGSVLYGVLSSNQRIDRSANPTATTPTWTVEDPHAGEGDTNVSSIAALGDELYATFVASSRGVHRRNSAGTWAHWSNQDSQLIWSVKGRIVGNGHTGATNELYELASGTGSVLLHSLAPGESWTAVADADSVILAASTDGLLYAFAEQNGELALVGQSSFGGQEYVASIGVSQGIVLLATNDLESRVGRLYRGVIVGRRLRNVQLIHKWDAVASLLRYPPRILASRTALWMPVIESTTETHVWRYDLTTGGLQRALVFSDVSWTTGGYAEGIIEFEDRIFIRADGEGLYREDDTAYVTSGYLISPLADFFNAAEKTWVGARLETGDLPAGTAVTLAYSTDPDAIDDPGHASWTTIITANPANPASGDEVAIIGEQSRWIAAKLTLTTSDTSVTPEVRAFSLRGLPLPTETDYQIPVNISDQLEIPHRKRLRVKNLGEQTWGRLKDLEGKAATVTLLRPDEVVKGQIRSVSAPIQDIPERGSPTTYALMTIRGQRQ